MPNLYGRDANGNDAYIQAQGSGTALSPYATVHDLLGFGILSAQAEASGNTDIVTAVSGYKIRVLGLVVSASAACSVRFQTGGSGNLSPNFRIPSGDTVTIANSLGLFETTTGDKLNAVLSGTANYGILCTYRLV